MVRVRLKPGLSAIGTLHVPTLRRDHFVGDLVLRIAIQADKPHKIAWFVLLAPYVVVCVQKRAICLGDALPAALHVAWCLGTTGQNRGQA